MIQAALSYHKQKVIQALRYHFINKREIKLLIILVNVFALVSALLYSLKKVSPAAFMLGSLLWFLLMLTFWFILPRVIYNRTGIFQQTFRLTIDNQHLALTNDSGEVNWSWNKFESWLESPHFFHVYLTPTQFMLIPKEIFSDDEQVHTIRRWLKEGIAKA